MLERIDADRLRARCSWCFRTSPPVPAPEASAEARLTELGWVRLLDRWACPICQKRAESSDPRG